METSYEKVDDTTIKVIKPAEKLEIVETSYSLDFLRQQEIDILKQKNDFCEARDVELEEVRTLIAQAEKLGVKSAIETETAREEILNNL